MSAGDPGVPELREIRIRLGPSDFWSGRRRFVCDGIVVTLTLAGPGAGRIERLVVHELIDWNIAGRRAESELREHVRLCLRMMSEEGILIRRGDAHVLVPGDRVHLAPDFKIQQRVQRDVATGPFELGWAEDDEPPEHDG